MQLDTVKPNRESQVESISLKTCTILVQIIEEEYYIRLYMIANLLGISVVTDEVICRYIRGTVASNSTLQRKTRGGCTGGCSDNSRSFAAHIGQDIGRGTVRVSFHGELGNIGRTAKRVERANSHRCDNM
jgi:hypothetical protein